MLSKSHVEIMKTIPPLNIYKFSILKINILSYGEMKKRQMKTIPPLNIYKFSILKINILSYGEMKKRQMQQQQPSIKFIHIYFYWYNHLKTIQKYPNIRDTLTSTQ